MKLPTGRPAASATARALRRLLPRTLTQIRPSADWRLAIVETLAVMSLAIGLSAWLRPADPFWLAAGFPWLWLVAAILALRYGSVHAVLAMGVALAGWLLIDTWGGNLGDFPRVSFLGGLVLALVAGEFSDVWNARQHQGQAVTAYLDERLQSLTHHHFLMNVSHDRLEQELLARPFTLRETLFALRQMVAARSRTPDAADGGSSLPAGDWLLQLLAQSCRLETAALFAVRDGELDGTPVATLGEFSADRALDRFTAGDTLAQPLLDRDDPMLAAALESGQLMHVQSEPFVESDRPSRYVIVAPLSTSSGEVLGVLAVERIAFTALTLETLQFLTVLLAYYADGLRNVEGTQPLRDAYPLCPDEFAVELVRLQRLLETAFINSSLVAFALPGGTAAAEEWAARFERMRRNVDLAWLHNTGRRRVLLMLLPLTNAGGVDGYLERVATTLRSQYATDLQGAGIELRTAEIDTRPLPVQLAALIAAVAGDGGASTGGSKGAAGRALGAVGAAGGAERPRA